MCGTIRAGRKDFLADLKEHANKGFREIGESETRHCTVNKNLTLSVTACSTYCQSVPLDEVQSKQKDGSWKTFPCPHSITTYNKYMGGVDRNNQLREYYHVRLKSRKYYKYLFWMMFDVSITNAFIISKSNQSLSRDTKLVKAFRTSLAHQLLDGYCSRIRKGSSVITKKYRNEHYPFRGNGKQHRCYYCSLQGVRKETWYCSDCDLYLCHKGLDTYCFLQYHLQHM